MSEAGQRFMEAVVEPLEDNDELKFAAWQELELSAEAGEDDFNRAAERLESAGPSRWRWIWMAAVLVVSVPMLMASGGKLLRALRATQIAVDPLAAVSGDPKPFWQSQLTGDELLLLHGEPGHPGETDTWRPLWRGDPDNAAYYIHYALAHESEHGEMPDDFLETGGDIDPGNGWFALKAAASGLGPVVEKKARTGGRLAARKASEEGQSVEWEIKDGAGLAQRIELLKRAASADRLDSYQTRLTAERFSKLPVPEDLGESVQVIAYQAGTRFDDTMMKVADLIGAEAQRCRLEGDREGFEELTEVWERVMASGTASWGSLVEGMVTQSALQTTLPPMRDAAVELGIEAEKWTDLEQRVRERRNRLRDRQLDGETVDRITRHGSMLASLSLPMIGRQVENPPEITRQDLLPACRTDQALIGRVAMVVGWQILGLGCLLSLACRGSQPVLLKRLRASLRRLFDRRDALWIGLGGVLGPVAVFFFLRHATPFARLDWGPRLTMFVVPLSHFIGLLLMLWVWPVAIAMWRLGRRGAVLDWRWRKRWAVPAMFAAPLGMVLTGLGVPPGGHSIPLVVAGAGCGLFSLVWVFLQASIIGSRRSRLRRGVVAEAVRPAWLGAMLVFSVLAVFFHAEERRWLARDPLTFPAAGFTKYEERVTEQLRTELREILDR